MDSRRTPSLILVLVLSAFIQLSCAEEDFQQWSVYTYMEGEYTFYCNDTLYPVFINPGDQLTWRRHGHEMDIHNDDHFQLSALHGVDNMALTIKEVNDDMTGFYFCQIRSVSGDHVGRIVKALNVGGHKYHDMIDKYRRNVVTGVIAGLSVFVLVVGICAIDHFRYQSEEERAEKRQAKEERLRRRHELKNVGHDNFGLDFNSSGNGNSKQGFDNSYDVVNDAPYVLNTQL